MSWQVVSLIALVGLWTVTMTAIHTWKEVRMVSLVSEDVRKAALEDAGISTS